MKKDAGLESLSSACRTHWMQGEASVFGGGYQVRSLRALPDVARGRRRRGWQSERKIHQDKERRRIFHLLIFCLSFSKSPNVIQLRRIKSGVLLFRNLGEGGGVFVSSWYPRTQVQKLGKRFPKVIELFLFHFNVTLSRWGAAREDLNHFLKEDQRGWMTLH